MYRKIVFLLILIFLTGAFFRFWGLGSQELTFDEGLYAFRSIGYLDYLESAAQSTPIQWLAGQTTLPFWLHLSFHDHPPLFFLIQHLFFFFGGISLFAARMPSALTGLGSVFLFYLIASDMFRRSTAAAAAFEKPRRRTDATIPQNELAGLFAAAVSAVSFAAVSVSRLSMLEAVLIFFILLNIYFFLRFLERSGYWIAFGITFGLAALTKYVAGFLIPLYLAFLLIHRRSLLKHPRFYAALLLAVLIFSPVIIYNINLERAFGHFDLQFSYLLGQKVAYWQGASGKTQEPFSNLKENLLTIFSVPFILIALAGAALACLRRWLWPLAEPRAKEMIGFILLTAAAITLLLVATGSAIRFSVLYLIPGVLFITVAFMTLHIRTKTPHWVLTLAALFLAYEFFFTTNTLFLHPPDYGVVKLDHYFETILDDARAAGVPRHPNPHLDRIIQTYAWPRPALLPPTGLIYDDNLSVAPMLWLFSRRQYYQGIPIMPASAFLEALRKNGPAEFKGFQLYFVKTEAAAPLRQAAPLPYGAQTETLLQTQYGIAPAVVVNGEDNAPAFRVYKFSFTNSAAPAL